MTDENDGAIGRDDHLEPALREWAARNARSVGLGTHGITVSYVLNWGGFVNRSYRVTDGRRTVYLKLTDEPQQVAALRRWRDLRSILEVRYHAPPQLGWVGLPGTPFQGIAFEGIHASTPEDWSNPWFDEVYDTISRLHRDDEIVERLGGPNDQPCWRTYLTTFGERFTEDLALIADQPPPFVSTGRLQWMRNEATMLAHQVRQIAAFDRRDAAPIHTDLWPNNVLVAPHGWYLLDWDDLSIGDPALDVAMLLGPVRRRFQRRSSPSRPHAPPMTERIAVYQRASLLDWIIDPLADWVAAEDYPTVADTIRRDKESAHTEALSVYRHMYTRRAAS